MVSQKSKKECDLLQQSYEAERNLLKEDVVKSRIAIALYKLFTNRLNSLMDEMSVQRSAAIQENAHFTENLSQALIDQEELKIELENVRESKEALESGIEKVLKDKEELEMKNDSVKAIYEFAQQLNTFASEYKEQKEH